MEVAYKKKTQDIEAKEEEFLGIKKAEIRESTISEYRKGQVIRLIDVFAIGPICIYAGVRYRKEMPTWLSTSLVIIGASTVYYNAKNFMVNWKQDGKLIKEALKRRKEDEEKEDLQNVSGALNNALKSVEKEKLNKEQSVLKVELPNDTKQAIKEKPIVLEPDPKKVIPQTEDNLPITIDIEEAKTEGKAEGNDGVISRVTSDLTQYEDNKSVEAKEPVKTAEAEQRKEAIIPPVVIETEKKEIAKVNEDKSKPDNNSNKSKSMKDMSNQEKITKLRELQKKSNKHTANGSKADENPLERNTVRVKQQNERKGKLN